MPRELLALLVFGLVFASLVKWTRRILRRPLGLLWPIASGLLVAWEAILLNFLSLLRWVSPAPVLAGNLLLVALTGWYLGSRPRPEDTPLYSLVWRRLQQARIEWMYVPLLGLLLVCAVVFPPANWDSMTCHMARVAHWIQNRSIEYYPTSNIRQNVFTPGAQYLILVLQLMSGSDRWANSVQFFSYAFCLFSIPTLARLAGVPRGLSTWAAPFVAGLPIAVLEASTPQNDAVAALMTLAILAALVPFLRSSCRWRTVDMAALSVMGSAAFLVKPTALLVASPFLALGLLRTVCAFFMGSPRSRRSMMISTGIALSFSALVAGPDMYRKARETGSALGSRLEVYPLTGAWQERGLNSVRAYCQNALFPKQARRNIEQIESVFHAEPARLFCDSVFRPNEDRAGNPLQAAVSLLIILFALLFSWRLSRRELYATGCVVLAWVIVHAFVRNQEFITRLQLPIFMITPLMWGAFASRRLPGAGLRGYLLRIATIACMMAGYVTASTNQFKPLSIPTLLSMSRDYYYYAVSRTIGIDFETPQDATLTMLGATGCRRLGLYIPGDSWEYPLTWRAMRLGVRVKHYTTPSHWPCLIFSNSGPPPGISGQTWIEAGTPMVYRPQEQDREP